jgi:hypothetical protein
VAEEFEVVVNRSQQGYGHEFMSSEFQQRSTVTRNIVILATAFVIEGKGAAAIACEHERSRDKNDCRIKGSRT